MDHQYYDGQGINRCIHIVLIVQVIYLLYGAEWSKVEWCCGLVIRAYRSWRPCLVGLCLPARSVYLFSTSPLKVIPTQSSVPQRMNIG